MEVERGRGWLGARITLPGTNETLFKVQIE